ncbi:glycosyltransferase [Actibacterium lipolyticum]|uniref:N-glycosyltransferase n=1 Tax=Actibacterium lipolyticum TaxID=1524263 RepID=A0A238KXY6_9RHOB|nr:glycosyltransferase [Actibacterium lipolyticum]SMX46916.1 N-glycosyltransferase [Actibacterium lipolyticum]
MIRRAIRLFHSYATRHGKITRAGFPLLDGTGQKFGHVERVLILDGRLTIEGWAFAETVGLTTDEHSVSKTPDMVRHDVPAHVSATEKRRTPGFSIDQPVAFKDTAMWAEKDGTRYSFDLPPITRNDIRKLKLRQVLPFLRDAARAFPAALRWLVWKDPLAVAQIKTILKLNTVPRSVQLNSFLFAQDVEIESVPPAALAETGITIVLPVYNAADLLPDVLNRVCANTDLPWRLIIIEDCSSDTAVRPWLRNWLSSLDQTTQDRVSLIENDQNLGFIQSVNKAFELALPFGDHVVLLNSDAFVPERWASRLIRPILEHDNVATVTPMSNDAEIFTVPVICQRTKLAPGEADKIDKTAQLFFPGADLADAPTGVGFCMAINVKFLQMQKTLDTGFGRGYGEEVDWCQRIRAKGGRHLGHGGIFVEHRGGTSFGYEEKLKLVQTNNAIISRRYPDYDEEVQDFIRHDPLTTPRLALAMAWAANRQTGDIPVYVAHDMGGGAEHYLQDQLKADLSNDAAAIVLRVGGMSRWQIELYSKYGITRGETDDAAFVSRLLGLFRSCRVIYSCGVGDHDPAGLPQALIEFASRAEDSIEVLIHDYFPLSPSYTLLGQDGAYHGLPDAAANTDPAHETKRPDGQPVSLAEWRAEWGKLLAAADRIVVFSQSSARLLSDAYPDTQSQIVVKPHKLITDVPNVEPGCGRDGVPVIGVLGNIGYQKGAGVLSKLAKELAKTNDAQLVVIGNIDPAFPLSPPAKVHGDYRIQDIPALVQRYGISCWLMPSIWPETFSYTTHETLATGLPVWCFDLGAQADTVAKAAATLGQGGVIKAPTEKSNPHEIIELILQTPQKVLS